MISFADYEQLIFSSPDSQQTKDKLTAGETSSFLPFDIYILYPYIWRKIFLLIRMLLDNLIKYGKTAAF
jgi:hypothetical protein